MAIRPISFDATGVTVVHDERGGHGGVVPWADIDFPKLRDGTPHQHFITLPCPVAGCDSVSLHPVSGGADRDGVRELFARYYQRRAAPLGLDAATLTAARALVAQRADEMEGRAAGRGG